MNYKKINAALEAIAASRKNFGFCAAKDLTSNPDMLHFDARSARELGIRYFKAYESLMAGGSGIIR